MLYRARLKQRVQQDMERLIRAVNDSEFRNCSAVPDFPFVGSDYGNGKRILVVGKANLRWPPPWQPNFLGANSRDSKEPLGGYADRFRVHDILEASWNINVDFRERRVAERYDGHLPSHRRHSAPEDMRGYASPWWKFVLEFGRTFLGKDAGSPKNVEVMRQIAVSNVFKCSEVEANPSPDFERLQVDAGCYSMLVTELEVLKPDIVLFATSRGFDQHISSALAATIDTMPTMQYLNLARVSAENTAMMFRSNHPQQTKVKGFTPGLLKEISKVVSI